MIKKILKWVKNSGLWSGCAPCNVSQDRIVLPPRRLRWLGARPEPLEVVKHSLITGNENENVMNTPNHKAGQLQH